MLVGKEICRKKRKGREMRSDRFGVGWYIMVVAFSDLGKSISEPLVDVIEGL